MDSSIIILKYVQAFKLQQIKIKKNKLHQILQETDELNSALVT